MTKLNPIEKGTIVKYNDGFFRVTRLTKNTVNLGSIFGNTIHHKGIDRNEIVEASEDFHKKWEESESYQCM